MTPVEAQVTALHAEFCRITGRAEPLRFHERAWADLLRSPEYQYDAAQLGADVEHLVRYLRMMISQAKRNPGALKLRNFLQPDQFLSDLAEARTMLKPKRPASPAAPAAAKGLGEMLSEEQAKQIAGKFREFRRGLR